MSLQRTHVLGRRRARGLRRSRIDTATEVAQLSLGQFTVALLLAGAAGACGESAVTPAAPATRPNPSAAASSTLEPPPRSARSPAPAPRAQTLAEPTLAWSKEVGPATAIGVHTGDIWVASREGFVILSAEDGRTLHGHKEPAVRRIKTTRVQNGRDLDPGLTSTSRAMFVPDHLLNLVARDDRGQALWSRPVLGGFETAAVAIGEDIVVASRQGLVVRAAGANGDSVWEHQSSAAFSAPLTVGDGLITAVDKTSVAVALDASTGAMRWSRKVSKTALAFTAARARGVFFVGLDDGAVVGLDLRSGQMSWKVMAEERPIALVGLEEHVVVLGMYGRALLLDAQTGARVWESDAIASASSEVVPRYPPSVHRGHLIVPLAYPSALVALSLADGSLVWSYTPAHGGGFDSTPTHAGNRIYVRAGYKMLALDLAAAE